MLPRPGDAPLEAHDDDAALSAEAQTEALAALYRRAALSLDDTGPKKR
jgi:hypothetical protein